MSERNKIGLLFESLPFDQKHYGELRRRNVGRLTLTYLAPLVLLSIYFYFQYSSIVSESRRLHLKAIAENQANTLDLFLSERVVNLSNLIDDPRFAIPPGSVVTQGYLDKLKQNSAAFVDIGYFDPTGVQAAYAGPYPSLEKRNYGAEQWYVDLKNRDENFIITDIYLGFRQKPHFTIAVSRVIDNRFVVLRAALDPEKIYEYIRTLEGSHEVYTSIVNKDGYYQLVTSHIGTPLEASSLVPAETPRLGADKIRIQGKSITYAYSWLKMADWALIVQWSQAEAAAILTGFTLKIVGISALLILATFLIIIVRANKLTAVQMEADRTRAQLEHAAKLASVGELAAGIAHEINNPLASINEEAGLVKDLMNPEYGESLSAQELAEHLDTIQESVFRCRDITRKLLGFVRKTEMDLKPHDLHQLIDGVIDGLLGNEMPVSNIEMVKNYGANIPPLMTDGNQLQQVLLNIINNGVDAIDGKPGKITVATSCDGKDCKIALSDTGKGIRPDQLDKIFLPFYTTKEVGKGTGLGLPVSYGIIKNLGGKIDVESAPGRGSTFTIVLPVH